MVLELVKNVEFAGLSSAQCGLPSLRLLVVLKFEMKTPGLQNTRGGRIFRHNDHAVGIHIAVGRDDRYGGRQQWKDALGALGRT